MDRPGTGDQLSWTVAIPYGTMSEHWSYRALLKPEPIFRFGARLLTNGHADSRISVGLRLLPVLLATPICAGLLLSSLISVYLWLHPYPVMDMVTVLDGYFELPWVEFLFFKRDNEHLPWLAMPFFAADILLFGAKGIFLIIVILILNSAIALSLSYLINLNLCNPIDRLMTVLLSISAFFWLLHAENLIWPKQIHMYLSLFLFLAACLCMVRADRQMESQGGRAMIPVAAILLLLTGSTFSFAYGIVGWIAIILSALTLRWPGRVILILIFGLLACLVIYLLNYAPQSLPSHHTSVADALANPLKFFWYILHYIGHPVRRLLFGIREISLLLTLAAIIFSFWLIYGAVQQRKSVGEAVLLAILLFSMGAADITALSRFDFGSGQAETLRYGVVQVLFWAALTGMALPFLRRVRGPHWFCAAVIALMVPFQAKMISRLQGDHAETWTAVTALVTGAGSEGNIKERLHPDLPQLLRVTQNMRQFGLSIFADGPAAWMGDRIDQHVKRTEDDACSGWFQTTQAAIGPTHITVEGETHETATGGRVEWVVMTLLDGRIVGLGHEGSFQDKNSVTWRGYAQADGEHIRVYGLLLRQRQICPLTRKPNTERS